MRRLTPPAEPPAVVTFDDALPYLERGSAGRLFLGLGPGGAPVWLPLADLPHIGLSARTGMGATTIARLLAAQMLHGGGEVVIIDLAERKESHEPWCRDEHGALLSGVELYRDVTSATSALSRWAVERQLRSNTTSRIPWATFRRVLFVMENAHVTVPVMQRCWEQARGPEEPLRSPALVTMDSILSVGRLARMHVLLVARRRTSTARGRGTLQENIGIEIYGTRGRRGRFTVVIEGQTTDVQVPLLTADQARTWADTGSRMTSTKEMM